MLTTFGRLRVNAELLIVETISIGNKNFNLLRLQDDKVSKVCMSMIDGIQFIFRHKT